MSNLPFLLGFLLLSAMMFVDCVPVGTSVDDTSVALARFEPYGLFECVPSDKIVEEDACSFCECLAVGSVISGYSAMLCHFCCCFWWSGGSGVCLFCAWCFEFRKQVALRAMIRVTMVTVCMQTDWMARSATLRLTLSCSGVLRHVWYVFC